MARALLTLVLISLILVSLSGTAYAVQVEIHAQVLGAGGITSDDGGVLIQSTLGQTLVGHLSDVRYLHGVGFWYLMWTAATTSVEDPPSSLVPLNGSLDQNRPNPFNSRTAIRFVLTEAGHTTLRIFDVRGREVAVLLDEPLGPGEHTIIFHGTELASGVYIYRLQSDSFTQTHRFTLVK